MIEIPRQFAPNLLTTKSVKRNITFNSISKDEEPPVFIERRLAPTRRQTRQANKSIERRVSLDRRRPTFSSKA